MSLQADCWRQVVCFIVPGQDSDSGNGTCQHSWQRLQDGLLALPISLQTSVWPPPGALPTKQTCIEKSSIPDVQAAKPDASTDPNSAAARDQTGTASSSAPGAGAQSAQGAQAGGSQASGRQQRQRQEQQQAGAAGAGAQQEAQQQATAAGGLSRLWAAARNEVKTGGASCWVLALCTPRTQSCLRSEHCRPAVPSCESVPCESCSWLCIPVAIPLCVPACLPSSDAAGTYSWGKCSLISSLVPAAGICSERVAAVVCQSACQPVPAG